VLHLEPEMNSADMTATGASGIRRVPLTFLGTLIGYCIVTLVGVLLVGWCGAVGWLRLVSEDDSEKCKRLG
jgi:hypothetical protein